MECDWHSAACEGPVERHFDPMVAEGIYDRNDDPDDDYMYLCNFHFGERCDEV